jgi:type 1 fimbria pilin
MKMWTAIRAVLLLCGVWVMADAAMATSCNYEGGSRPSSGYMPLQVASITVGRDVALGSVVYRQRYTSASPINVLCESGPFTVKINYVYSAIPKPLSNWATGPYAGKVYLTDVAGIGVVYNTSQAVAPATTGPFPFCEGAATCNIGFARVSDFELLLIKIGDVSAGAIQGANLPTVDNSMTIGNTSVRGFWMSVSGTINIVSQTCTTPDQTVAMGSQMVGDFKGVNTTTPWKNFVISLRNCPAFMGSFSNSGPSWSANSGNNPSGTAGAGTKVGNSLSLRLDPVRPAMDAAKGILSIEPAGAGKLPSATGVGVQVGSTRTANPLPLSTALPTGLVLLPTSASYDIPLSARYIQTAAKVTPGPANASATFTIVYK